MPLVCPHCSKEITGWVPEDRLKKATADKREAAAQAALLALARAQSQQQLQTGDPSLATSLPLMLSMVR